MNPCAVCGNHTYNSTLYGVCLDCEQKKARGVSSANGTIYNSDRTPPTTHEFIATPKERAYAVVEAMRIVADHQRRSY